LTRDRRGFENTFLMHADRPGDRPRLLYWYRTAPGIILGRSPLDEDAIRNIEDQHPDIDFDWPAILALSEVMTPEDEAPVRPQKREQPQGRRQKPPRESRPSSQEPQPDMPSEESTDAVESVDEEIAPTAEDVVPEREEAPARVEHARPSGLVDQLAGREIAARLRSRYDEIVTRIKDADHASREGWLKRAEAMDPDRWDTPEAVLQGVTNADAQFEQLRVELHSSRE
jgi:outer membrane biosynthesis protein TonB